MSREEIAREWRRLGRQLQRAHMANDADSFDRTAKRMDRLARLADSRRKRSA